MSSDNGFVILAHVWTREALGAESEQEWREGKERLRWDRSFQGRLTEIHTVKKTREEKWDYFPFSPQIF